MTAKGPGNLLEPTERRSRLSQVGGEILTHKDSSQRLGRSLMMFNYLVHVEPHLRLSRDPFAKYDVPQLKLDLNTNHHDYFH